MVMEFVRGDTFEKVAEQAGAMGVSRAVELCTQVLDALSHAHRVGIVHRDLKPANLMLSESGIVKVMDFGLARMAGTEHLTNDGFMVGTPAYISPEQILGGEVDGRADLYAMAVVLYRLLTGQLPFKADSGIAMVKKQMYDEPTPVRQLRTELPSVCDDLFARALAKSPDDRFQTADEFKAALAFVESAASSELTRTLVSPLPRKSVHPVFEPAGSAPKMPAPAPAPAAAAQVNPLPQPRKPVAAFAGAVVLLLATIPMTIFFWRGRSQATDAAVTTAAPVPVATTSATPSAPEAAAPPPLAPVVESKPAVKPAARSVTPSPPTVAPAPNAAPLKTDNAPAEAVPSETAPAAAAPASVPSVVFNGMKYLTVEDGKARDRDASLRLEGDSFHVNQGNETIRTAAYREVIGIFQSHSKEPRWTAPDGTSLPVAKVGGKFSLFKGTPDWVTVRTKNGFIPLRVDEGDLKRVITELEARTGTKVIRAK